MSSANLIYLVSLAIFTFFHSLQLTLRFSGVISPEVLPFFNHKLRYSAEISAFCLGDWEERRSLIVWIRSNLSDLRLQSIQEGIGSTGGGGGWGLWRRGGERGLISTITIDDSSITLSHYSMPNKVEGMPLCARGSSRVYSIWISVARVMKCTARPDISTKVSLPIKIPAFFSIFIYQFSFEENNFLLVCTGKTSFCRLWLFLLHVFSFLICDSCCKYTPGLRICIGVVGPDQISLQI